MGKYLTCMWQPDRHVRDPLDMCIIFGPMNTPMDVWSSPLAALDMCSPFASILGVLEQPDDVVDATMV